MPTTSPWCYSSLSRLQQKNKRWSRKESAGTATNKRLHGDMQKLSLFTGGLEVYHSALKQNISISRKQDNTAEKLYRLREERKCTSHDNWRSSRGREDQTNHRSLPLTCSVTYYTVCSSCHTSTSTILATTARLR